MGFRERVREQVRDLTPLLLRIAVPTAILFAALYMAAVASGIPFSSLSRDPATTYSFPWYGEPCRTWG